MEPRRQRVGSGCTKGDGSLAGPLAEDGGDPGVQVDIVDIEPGKLADPNAAGIQQLEDGAIPQGDRVARVARLRGRVHRRVGLARGQHDGQVGGALGADQPHRGVALNPTGSMRPVIERADAGSATRDGRARGAGPCHRSQPAA